MGSVLAEEGPFDGLLGFSQGAALCASILLQRTSESRAGKGLPVQCAVFICGSLPWILPESSHAISEIAVGAGHGPACDGFPATDEKDQTRCVVVSELYLDGEANETASRLDPRLRVDPAISPLRISIPTAHIIGGSKDEYFTESRALAELGDARRGMVRLFDHGQGHIVPRGAGPTKRMGDMIAWAVDRVKFRH